MAKVRDDNCDRTAKSAPHHTTVALVSLLSNIASLLCNSESRHVESLAYSHGATKELRAAKIGSVPGGCPILSGAVPMLAVIEGTITYISTWMQLIEEQSIMPQSQGCM